MRLAIVLVVLLASGCATHPDSLQAPSEITCVNLPEAISFTAPYGPLDVQWTTRLERGPYVSEKVDENGTYYRAPPGGVSIAPGNPFPADGGFIIPNNPNDPIKTYKYFSSTAAPVEIPPSDANCSTVGYVKDPSTSKVSFVSFAVSGALGGAGGALIGRSLAQGSKMSYGQAAGAGAAGGLIAGVIVAGMINAEQGRIVPGQSIKDAEFVKKLRALAATRVPVKEVQVLANPQPAGASSAAELVK